MAGYPRCEVEVPQSRLKRWTREPRRPQDGANGDLPLLLPRTMDCFREAIPQVVSQLEVESSLWLATWRASARRDPHRGIVLPNDARSRSPLDNASSAGIAGSQGTSVKRKRR